MPDPPETQPVPDGIRHGGAALWTSITKDYALESHELALLTQAVRTKDRLDVLHETIERDGTIISTREGEPKPNPALVEERQQSIVLTRLIASLRVPLGAEGDHQQNARTQRRSTRGVYGVRGIVP